jgi:DNA-binding NtrC family response regulator
MTGTKKSPNANLNVMLSSLAEAMRQETQNGASLPLREWMDLAESWRIWEALRQCNGNRSAAARQLKIGRRTLYAKIDRLGISFSEMEDTPALDAVELAPYSKSA